MNCKSRLKCDYCKWIVKVDLNIGNYCEWIVKVDLNVIIANVIIAWIVKLDLNIGNYCEWIVNVFWFVFTIELKVI